MNLGKSDKLYCMNCDDNKKILFIHIPRTAGKSIRTNFKLGLYDDNFHRLIMYQCSHRRAIHMPENVLKTFDTFVVIRNPLDRLVSLYNYYMYRKDLKPYNILSRYNNFNEFVLDLKNIPIASYRGEEINNKDMLQDNFNPCTYFICDNNKVLIKNIIRFENLNNDLKNFANIVNMNISFPLIKNKKGEHNKKVAGYNDYYNDKMIQKVIDVYKTDIEIFNYTLE